MFTEKLVAKPDQLIKRRGKAGLLCLNKDYKVAAEWIKEKAGKPVKVRALTRPTLSAAELVGARVFDSSALWVSKI